MSGQSATIAAPAPSADPYKGKWMTLSNTTLGIVTCQPHGTS